MAEKQLDLAPGEVPLDEKPETGLAKAEPKRLARVGEKDPPELKTVKGVLNAMEGSLRTVLPQHVKAEQLVKAALVSCQKTPLLLKCSKRSWMLAMMQAAETGLMPGGAMKHAHLLPFKNKRGEYEVVFVPGYQGLIALARNTGDIESIAAHVVYEKDVFKVDYGTETVTHEPNLRDDRGAPYAVYMRAQLTGGAVQFEILTKADVEKIKAASRGSGGADSPWQNWPDEMWRKSAIKRGSKYLPLSTEKAAAYRKAVAADDYAESGDVELLPDMMDEVPEGAVIETSTATDKLTKELTGA